MNNDDNNKMANQFIELWQENFAKTMQDPEIMLQLTKAMGFMQQFYGQQSYNKPFTATASASSQSGADELYSNELLRRISELEERVAKLETPGSGKRRPKKAT